ncbi:Zinc-exporting ATPase protein [Dioscorea alata]|uniref:Zinc-exporting ATPase protein n=4 Tax=Dioscorea alata TaxID=55571 RepID=A0ACB7WIX3_DIOAL|nr:Zinc-exporting ATPase protein [Dioscorea alata]KAH7688011.1 Zinc-exporting ATPase protein [Dioscorea alata]KAH7688012.1 Zinc-exporting ATPase protein [Dioscorea alata]
MEDEKRSKETRKYEKSYFDVLGLCCTSEVPLIEKILKPLEGVQKVTIIVPSRTVIVVHDSLLISQLQIVEALNQARLEATIRTYGTGGKIMNKWPSPYILACGTLLIISLFHVFFRPLRWLAVVAVAVGVLPIVLRSVAALRRFTLDINILMLIAVGGAIALRDYEEAGFIVFLFTIAEWLETMASHKATAGMSALMSMAPQKAILAETGQIVDARDVKVDTILAVKAGEVIPIDGIVVDGRSEVDERTLTGESFPVAKQVESQVWAGTLNIDGYISVRTTALAENSAVAKMARLVEEAQSSRSKTQRLIDSCTKYYTPAVVIIAAGVAVIPLITKTHKKKHWFKLALVLLVSACPCALVLSTPVATFCGLLKAARKGLLIKGGDVLEALAGIKVAAFDKTGTITRGEFTILKFIPIGNSITIDKLLYWVASIESKSSHPMASALVDYARWKSVEPKPDNVSEFQIHAGEGIQGQIDGCSIYIGNKRIATRAGCPTVRTMNNVEEGVTVGYVFCNAAPIGIFTLSDTCRTGTAEAVKELKSLGVKTAMLTGDSIGAATNAQNQLGNVIEMIYAELLPEDKVRIVEELKSKEGSTLMVGDGMNDAPALAMANVGISMGISGSAVAMETSHITLMSNDIGKIPKAIQLARRTHRKIILNIVFSVITKVAILILAFTGHPLLWAAVLADVGTCLIVILNSMTLLRTKDKTKKKCCSSKNKLKKACCSNENKHHDHGKVHKHGCHENEMAHQHACSEHDHHDHVELHSQDCHEHKEHGHAKAHEHGCHDHWDEVHAQGCHEHDEHAEDHEHHCHDHGELHEHECHGYEEPHEHECHEHTETGKERT